MRQLLLVGTEEPELQRGRPRQLAGPSRVEGMSVLPMCRENLESVQLKRAAGAVAYGALAIGAGAIGALAIGRLSIRRADITHMRIERLEVGELTDLDGTPLTGLPASPPSAR